MAAKYSLRNRSTVTVLDENLEVEESSSSDSEIELPKQRQKIPSSAIKSRKKEGQSALNTLNDLEDALDAVADSYFGRGIRKTKDDDDEKRKDNKSTTVAVPLIELKEWLESADDHLPNAAQELIEKHRALFPRYMVYLCERFNLLFYGFGSKKELLDEFCETKLAANDYTHFVIRGYMPNISIKSILMSVVDNLKLEINTSGVNSVELSHLIKSALNEQNEEIGHIILVVHNIDGPSLRDENSQTALSVLASCSNIRFVASIDHVNASLLWDQTKLARFRWVWLDGTTYKCYKSELSVGESRILGLNSRSSVASHSLASIESVWASLTHNSQAVFVEFAKACLSDHNPDATVPFWELYRICKDEFLVSSETALKQLLVEFQDHHLISSKRAQAGGDLLSLTIDKKMLSRFLLKQGYDIIENNGNGVEDE